MTVLNTTLIMGEIVIELSNDGEDTGKISLRTSDSEPEHQVFSDDESGNQNIVDNGMSECERKLEFLNDKDLSVTRIYDELETIGRLKTYGET